MDNWSTEMLQDWEPHLFIIPPFQFRGFFDPKTLDPDTEVMRF